MSELADYASLDDVERRARESWRPPPKLTLSQWADEHFYLSAESSAAPGRWKTIPYQKGIMDAATDPSVVQVSVIKSARVGWTKIVNALVGYSIHQDPCPLLVVQPTIEDAKGYSKEEIAPMLRDCPALAKIVIDEAEEAGPRDSGNTILHKRFPGGVLSLVGANSGAGFRRVSRKRVLFDEVDGYPASAGSDGDPIKLGIKRTEYYWDRKILAGSTPLIAGHSRIETLFLEGDQRRYYVPCPQCGHMDFLVFSERPGGGHFMRWLDKPEDAFFVCSANGCVIEHKHKRDMVERGEWRASQPFKGHASFHIWAAYSYSPNATWGQLALEFLSAKKDREQLKTFINTVLGETWQEEGDAPEWERIYQRRETYQIGKVPAGVQFLTVGTDVQKDRVVYEVVGWGANRESWSIEAGVLPLDISVEANWPELDKALVLREFEHENGTRLGIALVAMDSGYNTQHVYNWTRRHPMNRVIAVKGMSSSNQRVLVSSPSPVEVTHHGKKIARGTKMWPVGSDVAKGEFYGYLRQNPPTTESGAPFPAGFCHFPQYGEDYFKQITAEHLVSTKDKRGATVREWQVLPGRENHFLDARVYARAAAFVAGLDRLTTPTPPTPVPASPAPVFVGQQAPAPPQPARPTTDYFRNRGRGQWLSRRR